MRLFAKTRLPFPSLEVFDAHCGELRAIPNTWKAVWLWLSLHATQRLLGPEREPSILSLPHFALSRFMIRRLRPLEGDRSRCVVCPVDLRVLSFVYLFNGPCQFCQYFILPTALARVERTHAHSCLCVDLRRYSRPILRFEGAFQDWW